MSEISELREDDPIESGLTVGQIALSAYRACWHASETKPPMLEEQDDGIKQDWLQMIMNLDETAHRMEGRTICELMWEIVPQSLRRFGDMPLEAAIRMAWMLFSTEIRYADSPEALEAEELLFGEWAANKRSSS